MCSLSLVAGTYNNNTHIYDVTSLQHLHHLTGHVGIINVIIVSPSGRFMFTGSSDSSVMVSRKRRTIIIIAFTSVLSGLHELDGSYERHCFERNSWFWRGIFQTDALLYPTSTALFVRRQATRQFTVIPMVFTQTHSLCYRHYVIILRTKWIHLLKVDLKTLFFTGFQNVLCIWCLKIL